MNLRSSFGPINIAKNNVVCAMAGYSPETAGGFGPPSALAAHATLRLTAGAGSVSPELAAREALPRARAGVVPSQSARHVPDNATGLGYQSAFPVVLC